MALTCPCGEKLNLEALLDSTAADAVGQSGMFGLTCPQCRTAWELRLQTGKAELGYTYFGGSLHFEGIHAARLSALTVTVSEPDDVDIQLHSRHWHFGIRKPSRQRFCILAGAFAQGKRAGELDFAQWGVLLTSVERGTPETGGGPDSALECGDFLHLEGPAPSLTQAWYYLNDGPTSGSDKGC